MAASACCTMLQCCNTHRQTRQTHERHVREQQQHYQKEAPHLASTSVDRTVDCVKHEGQHGAYLLE
eukprot:4472355-Alexandrium_andersonii.AAC.1